jgi:hypothetical protein
MQERSFITDSQPKLNSSPNMTHSIKVRASWITLYGVSQYAKSYAVHCLTRTYGARRKGQELFPDLFTYIIAADFQAAFCNCTGLFSLSSSSAFFICTSSTAGFAAGGSGATSSLLFG